MSYSIWYTSPLTCCRCGSRTLPRGSRMRSAALNPDPSDREVSPGDLLDVGLPDLADAFEPSARWPPDAEMLALEAWTCPNCRSTQAALVTLASEGDAGWRLAAVRATGLTPEVLASVHGASRDLRDTMYPQQLALLNPP